MTDPGMPPLPPPNAPAPSSVVVDEHATVHVSKWPVWVAVIAVIAFVAFAVGWFVVDEADSYTPGPMAAKFLASNAEQGLDVELSDDALRCIDDKGEGLDPEVVFGEGTQLDPFSNTMDPNAPEVEFLGAVFDECLSRSERVDLFAASVLADDGDQLTKEQAECIAGALDDGFMDAGGYSTIFADPEAAMGVLFGLLGAFQDCGVDMSTLG